MSASVSERGDRPFDLTLEDLGPCKRCNFNRNALLPVGAKDFRVLSRVGDEDKVRSSFREDLFSQLASSSSPVSCGGQGQSHNAGHKSEGNALDSVEVVLPNNR